MGLAEFGLLHAVDLCNGDVLSLEGGGSFFVMRGERFAMSAPKVMNKMVRWFSLLEKGIGKGIGAHHGAKNSTRMSSFGLTMDSKLEAVRSITSESSAAKTLVAAARKSVESRDRRIALKGPEQELYFRRGSGGRCSILEGRHSHPVSVCTYICTLIRLSPVFHPSS